MTGRNPEPTSEVTTKVMKANKGKDTGPEQAVRRLLRRWVYQDAISTEKSSG